MPRGARSWAGRRVMSRPRKATVPARTGRSPMMLSIVVVFPAPFRPTRQTASPSLTASETPRRICAGPRKVSMRSSSSMIPGISASPRGADERGRDGLVAPDLVWRPVGEDRALVHGDDPVGVVEDDVHVVLDDRRGDAPGSDDRRDRVHDGRLLARAHAARRLVEEQELRPERVRDGEVEELALALRDAAREHPGRSLEAEEPRDV